jgi:hypothetical protein
MKTKAARYFSSRRYLMKIGAIGDHSQSADRWEMLRRHGRSVRNNRRMVADVRRRLECNAEEDYLFFLCHSKKSATALGQS